MKHFKNPINNELFAYESDGSQDRLIPANFIPVNDDEAQNLRDAAWQQSFDKFPYTLKRANEYPPIEDYIDGVVKGDQTQIEKYIADCLVVKAKYPKPE